MVSILQKRTWTQSENVQVHDVRGLVLQPQIKTSPNFQQMNKPYRISSFFINLVVTNEEGGVGGRAVSWKLFDIRFSYNHSNF